METLGELAHFLTVLIEEHQATQPARPSVAPEKVDLPDTPSASLSAAESEIPDLKEVAVKPPPRPQRPDRRTFIDSLPKSDEKRFEKAKSQGSSCWSDRLWSDTGTLLTAGLQCVRERHHVRNPGTCRCLTCRLWGLHVGLYRDGHHRKGDRRGTTRGRTLPALWEYAPPLVGRQSLYAIRTADHLGTAGTQWPRTVASSVIWSRIGIKTTTPIGGSLPSFSLIDADLLSIGTDA